MCSLTCIWLRYIHIVFILIFMVTRLQELGRRFCGWCHARTQRFFSEQVQLRQRIFQVDEVGEPMMAQHVILAYK